MKTITTRYRNTEDESSLVRIHRQYSTHQRGKIKPLGIFDLISILLLTATLWAFLWLATWAVSEVVKNFN